MPLDKRGARECRGRGIEYHNGSCKGRQLASAISNSPFTQVIRGQLNSNFVPGQNTDVVLSHLAGDVSRYNVPIF